MEEVWKDVVGYEGLYQVSSDGDIRTVKTGKIRKPSFDEKGKKKLNLSRDGKQVTHRVHRIVIEAFVGPKPEGMECRHLNGDQTDNRAQNLEWGTHLENMQDKVRHGTFENTTKLLESQAREIKKIGGVRYIARRKILRFSEHHIPD